MDRTIRKVSDDVIGGFSEDYARELSGEGWRRRDVAPRGVGKLPIKKIDFEIGPTAGRKHLWH